MFLRDLGCWVRQRKPDLFHFRSPQERMSRLCLTCLPRSLSFGKFGNKTKSDGHRPAWRRGGAVFFSVCCEGIKPYRNTSRLFCLNLSGERDQWE